MTDEIPGKEIGDESDQLPTYALQSLRMGMFGKSASKTGENHSRDEEPASGDPTINSSDKDCTSNIMDTQEITNDNSNAKTESAVCPETSQDNLANQPTSEIVSSDNKAEWNRKISGEETDVVATKVDSKADDFPEECASPPPTPVEVGESCDESLNASKETTHDATLDADKCEKDSSINDQNLSTEEIEHQRTGDADLIDIEEPCQLIILSPETLKESDDSATRNEEEQIQEADVKKTCENDLSASSGRRTRRKAPTRNGTPKSAKQDEIEEPDQNDKPSRTPTRARASKNSTTNTSNGEPKPRTSQASEKEEIPMEVEDDDVKSGLQEDSAEATTSRQRRGKAGPSGATSTPKKQKEKIDSDKDEDEPNVRSLRTRSSKIECSDTTPKTERRSVRTPATKKSETVTPRGRVQKVTEEESNNSPVRSSRRATLSKSEPAEKTPKSVTHTKGSKASDSVKKSNRDVPEDDIIDPYDVNTQFDQHPEPLKNIHMHVHSFGEMKFNKVGSGKYTRTEKTAEERVSNLSDLAPKAKERRSLAEFTPGRRHAATPKNVKSAPNARRNRSKQDDVEEEEMDVDDITETPSRRTAKKRRQSPVNATPSKKPALSVTVPVLSDDQQWEVDHPGDEHAPMEAGARVYAVFNKVYYPAIVIGERDGIGRYKVQFVEDQVVRDVPMAGLIPLRAVVAEKECYFDDFDAVVISSPNAASAPEWVKGVFKIEVNSGDDQKTTKEVLWSKLSLDMVDWKDYIHQKSIETTAVATDNISSTKTRRSRVAPSTPEVSTPTTNRSFKAAGNKASSAKKNTKSSTAKGKNISQANEEGDIVDADAKEETNISGEMDINDGGSDTSEDSTPLSLFKGMMFILTSAQRDGSSNFKKKLMSDFIQQAKGLVVEDINDVDSQPDMKAFLISDTHYRTHKYLSAMARGVPCVSHEWILKCRDSCSLADFKEYLLPAGLSILDQQIYPLPTNQANLLKDKTVLVHSNNHPSSSKALSFVEIWKPMIGLLGGQAVEQVAPETRIDIMLTDSSASPELLEKAQEDNALIVSSEWLIQGIIMDNLPEPGAHPRFLHDGSQR